MTASPNPTVPTIRVADPTYPPDRGICTCCGERTIAYVFTSPSGPGSNTVIRWCGPCAADARDAMNAGVGDNDRHDAMQHDDCAACGTSWGSATSPDPERTDPR